MSLFTGGIAAALALAGAGAKGGFDLAAASKSAGGQKDAAAAAAKGAEEALAFTKEQKAKQEAAAAPYLSLGQLATKNLPGVVRPMPTQGPPAPYTTQPAATRPAMPMSAFGSGMGPQMPTMGTPGGLVTLIAPDGTQKQIPAAQADFFIQRGARRI